MHAAPFSTTLTFAALICAVAVGCATKSDIDLPNAAASASTKVEVANTYDNKIEIYSQGNSEYAGFYNNFEFKATILNASVRELVVGRQAEYYKWDENKTREERDRHHQEHASKTQVFISFFTPDRQNDNLTDAKSIWRIYLEAGGQRYEGKAKRLRTNLAELQSLYPYHTRWNTPYMLDFSVPTTAIETQKAVLTITGPLGTRTITFNAIP